MAFLYDIIGREGIEIQYYDATFNDESMQAVYNSIPVPGDLDNLFFAGFKSAQGQIKVYYLGDDCVSKVQKLKSFCTRTTNFFEKIAQNITSTISLDGSYRVLNLKVANVPVKPVLVTSVSTNYELTTIEKGKITKAIATINFIELQETKTWWQTLLYIKGKVNTTTLPPDYQKKNSELQKAKDEITKLNKQIEELNKRKNMSIVSIPDPTLPSPPRTN